LRCCGAEKRAESLIANRHLNSLDSYKRNSKGDPMKLPMNPDMTARAWPRRAAAAAMLAISAFFWLFLWWI
jgi:hypothetical protein